MRSWVFICAVLISSIPALARHPQPVPPQPDQFTIGRRTFFDFGPPFDFYDLFLVRPTETGSSIERVTLTPAGHSCMQPAKVEVAIVSVGESIESLLGKANPCMIPEKELRRELKRCKKCLVFSGADVAIHVQCGSQSRVVRADILDKDMFDPSANTPKHTSWTMQLLERLDKATGSSVMDRPVSPLSTQEQTAPKDSGTLQDLSSGKYDVLFQGAPEKPSDLYRLAQNPPPGPEIQVLTSPPVRPEVLVQPVYPPIARLANVEGTVTVKFNIDPDGSTSSLVVESGHPMLRGAVEKAVDAWKFPREAASQEIRAMITFKACPARPQ